VIKIPLEDAVAGQRVARPVATPTGTVLLQAGEVLTSAVIAGLRRKGIDSLMIDGEVTGGVPSAADRLAELDVRFAGHDGNPLMMELKELMVRQIAQGAPRGTH